MMVPFSPFGQIVRGRDWDVRGALAIPGNPLRPLPPDQDPTSRWVNITNWTGTFTARRNLHATSPEISSPLIIVNGATGQWQVTVDGTVTATLVAGRYAGELWAIDTTGSYVSVGEDVALWAGFVDVVRGG